FRTPTIAASCRLPARRFVASVTRKPAIASKASRATHSSRGCAKPRNRNAGDLVACRVGCNTGDLVACQLPCAAGDLVARLFGCGAGDLVTCHGTPATP